MTVVIDVGCSRHGDDYSVERLIERFHPDILYGFDPNLTPETIPDQIDATESQIATRIELADVAAWTFNGAVPFVYERLRSHIDSDAMSTVPCIDLAEFIHSLGTVNGLILKIDAEGAEYALLDHLIATGADRKLALAWVEWHPDEFDRDGMRRAHIGERLHCSLEEWTF